MLNVPDLNNHTPQKYTYRIRHTLQWKLSWKTHNCWTHPRNIYEWRSRTSFLPHAEVWGARALILRLPPSNDKSQLKTERNWPSTLSQNRHIFQKFSTRLFFPLFLSIPPPCTNSTFVMHTPNPQLQIPQLACAHSSHNPLDISDLMFSLYFCTMLPPY